MRIALPIVLLLFGASSAHGQAQSAASRAESTAPAPAQAPVEPAPVASPVLVLPEEPAKDQPSARAEAAATGEHVQAQEKKHSRVVWFLVGAVVVLGVVLAATL
jgi:hypothetical protein